MPWIFAIALLFVSPALQAEIYRCNQGGATTYSDQPCGADSEILQMQDNHIGGRLDQNLPPAPATEPEPETQPPEQADTCRFINSTDLRRYIIRKQVVPGMTRDNVRRAFGNPPETYTSPREVWIYQTRYYGALYELTWVYFRDGCVEKVVYRKP